MVKGALADATPFAFLSLRTLFSLAVLWPLLRFRPPARASLGPGVLLGLVLGASYGTQTIGLLSTTATRSAFISGLAVVLVPFLYPMLTRRTPGVGATMGAVIAAIGLYLFTQPAAGALNRGDVWTFGCALAYALYVVMLEKASRKAEARDLLVIQSVVLAIMFLPGAIVERSEIHLRSGLIWGLLTTGPILAVSLYLMSLYQKETSAPRAAVIYTAEPVFAAGFAWLLAGETLSLLEWGGAGLILSGILVAVLAKR
jgi:drug/metabolite transporter (DMT)-like permease